MKPTIEILEGISKASRNHPDEIFTRLYRYVLRNDIYFVAYQHLYANAGAATKGVNEDTADGFSEEKISRIVESLRNETYQPHPARRTYIQKSNGKKRPLGIPTFTDKLVQEVVHMLLEAIYEPIFRDTSHGFRPGRSCHTALKDAKHQFNGSRWFIEGDIKGCFDNIDHDVLIALISRKIKDKRMIELIRKFLKAGYLEDWKYNNTYSGTPQGGILSPILANIYLHELDMFVEVLKEQFEQPPMRKFTPEYDAIRTEVLRIQYQLKKASEEEKSQLLKKLKEAKKQMRNTPSKSHTDKMLKYIRYADDFIIGVNGSKEDCERLKTLLTDFVKGTLKMELSAEKTLITHSNTAARFLGYDIRVRRSSVVKRKPGSKIKRRSLSNMTELTIPLNEKIHAFMLRKHVIEQHDGKLEPVKRDGLSNLPDLEIISCYNAELRGICNYYCMASNFYKLNYLSYIMEYSCLKTYARKYKCHISDVIERFKDGKGGWCIPYETKAGKKTMPFADYRKCKECKVCVDEHPNTLQYTRARTSFESRLKAKECELCGSTTSECYEIHHVNKVKNLSGKAEWEIIMIAKRRKTLVVCRKCHHKIHGQKN